MSDTEITLRDAKGKEIGTKAVSSDVFSTKAPKHLFHQVVRWQRAKWRAGTHSTQTRAEMSGGGKKPWKQKGTGNARAGSNTSSIWVGGGIAHGPKPRDYEFRLNKQERRRAIIGALSARNSENRLLLVDNFGLKETKTKDALKVLEAIGIKTRERTLVVLTAGDDVTARSLRNIERVTVIPAAGLNVYDILNAKNVVIVGDALAEVEKRFTAKDSGSDSAKPKKAAKKTMKKSAKESKE